MSVRRWIELADSPEASSHVEVMNDDGNVLLIRRTDNKNWALPGGAMDIGETIAEAAFARPGRRRD